MLLNPKYSSSVRLLQFMFSPARRFSGLEFLYGDQIPRATFLRGPHLPGIMGRNPCRNILCLADVHAPSNMTSYRIYVEHCGALRAGSHASAIFAPTDREERLNWSVNEYVSSFGKVLVRL
jgi:hypothetical protein